MDYLSDFSAFFNHPLLLWLAGNTQGITLLVVLILFLLLVSFFVSGAEVAFFSLSYKDVNMLKTKQDAGWKRIVGLLEDPKILLASLLIANTLVNVAIIILSNFLIDELLPIKTIWWVFDFLIKGGLVVDGSGGPGRLADGERRRDFRARVPRPRPRPRSGRSGNRLVGRPHPKS